MAINMIPVKCPDCGATLDGVDSSREHIFCSYCGAKVIIQNDNEYVYRHIDEAGVKQAETDRIVKMKQLEMMSQENDNRKLLIMAWLGATGFLTLLGIIGLCFDNEGLGICLMLGMCVGMWGGIFLFMNNNNQQKNKRVVGANEVMISDSMTDYSDKDFNSIVMLYRSAGFNNVNAFPMNDLNLFTMKNNGKVDSVTINGDGDFSSGDVFSKSACVIINYHNAR